MALALAPHVTVGTPFPSITTEEENPVSTTAELAARYLEERVARRELDPMTARNHRSALAGFIAVIGDTPPSKITRFEVEQWLALRAHLAPSTRRSDFSTVKCFLGWLHRQGRLRTNPALEVRAPRQPRSVPRALPSDAVGRLLGACPDARARAIVWLMVGMGLRCLEVARVELGDWDRHGGLMVVRGKGSHERAVPVPCEVRVAVETYLAEHPSIAGALIRSYKRPGRGLAADTISGMVSEWMRAAGVKRLARDGVSAHALRHTAASDVLDGCNDLRVVQAMLGHQQLSTTSIYLRRAALGQMRLAMAGRTYSISS